MAKKQTKKHILDIENLIGNDFIFLYLQLIGYPDPEPGELLVREFKKYRFERLDDENMCKIWILLEEDGALKIKNESSIIKITEKGIKFIQDALDLYIERFIKGELVPFRGAPYKYKKQRSIFLEKIEKEIEDSQAILNFSDADFDDKFNFFECVLALEKQGAIKVKNIYNERNPKEEAFYRVAFEVKNKSLKEIGVQKKKRTLKLHCFSKGATGYFQIKNNTEKREIGPKNSRHFLLLKYLVNKGVGETVSFEQAYNAVKDGSHYGSKSYLDEMETVIENSIKALQKKNRIKPYKIETDKRQRKIWIE